ncbi:Cell death protease [Rhodotorula kratochvilovae]
MVAGPLRTRLAPSDPRTRRGAPADADFARLVQRARDLAPRQANPDDDMSAASFFIPSLPGQPSDVQLTMYGGHIPSAPPKNGAKDTQSDAHLFFFMVRNKHIADTERTLLWFNGGPGCSSFDGGLMEIGPFRLVPNGDGKLVEAEGAWNEYANVIFIDQPVGTGYSYMATDSYVHELPEAANHMIEFLVNFYKIFPEFRNHDTYLAGESYAGQYIPYIADAILSSSRVATRLKGLLIGNGWIDPVNQYPAYLDFALQAGVIKKGTAAETQVKKAVDQCLAVLNRTPKVERIHEGACERILGAITDSTIQNVNGQNMCVNNYDVRLTDTHPACGMNWPPDLVDMHPYLSRPDVKSAFHASRKTGPWLECDGQVGAQFYTPRSRPSVHLLPKLLEQVPVLMFAGAEDLICNHVGIERMIENLEWNGETGFGNATDEEWHVEGRQAGTWTTARNMTYVKIHDASHMVPYDQPIAAHDMFLRFVGASLLSAAGPAAQVPSRIGNEIPAVLGSTHLNGTALGSSSSSSSPLGGALDAGQLDALPAKDATADAGGKGSTLLRGDAALEGLVNASSALVLVALMGAAFALFLYFRRRAGGRISRAPGGEGWGALGGATGGGVRKHERVASLGRGVRVEEESDSREEGAHELDELMSRRGGGAGVGASAAGYRDESTEEDEGRGGRGVLGRRDEEEKVFGLGDDDDDEGSDEGGLPRRRRVD